MSNLIFLMEKKRIIEEIKIFFILILVIGGVSFFLAKTFWLNNPKVSSFEAAVSYLQLEQNSQRKEAEKYLFSNFENVEIFGEKYSVLKTYWFHKEKKGKEPIFKEKESTIEKDTARIILLEETNKNEGLIFFDFKLPEEIIFEIDLKKEGSWQKGYSWKIIKISSLTLVSESKIGKENEIGKNIFVKPIKIEEYMPPNLSSELIGGLPENLKSLTLEIEYKNNSDKIIEFSPFSEWRIIDKNGGEYVSPSETSACVLREPTLFGGELELNETKKGYIPFEVPKDVLPQKIIFKNIEKKIIFNLE